MTKTKQPTDIDLLLARGSIVGRCIVCRTLPKKGLDSVREFVEKRSTAGIISGETRLLPLLRDEYGAIFCVSSLRRHMEECCG